LCLVKFGLLKVLTLYWNFVEISHYGTFVSSSHLYTSIWPHSKICKLCIEN
jgi:hypothetical protein